MEVLDKQRHRAPDPGEALLKERTREREKAEKALQDLLQFTVQKYAGTSYAGPRCVQRSRRYLAEHKRFARQTAQAEAYLEQERVFRRLAEQGRSGTELIAFVQDMASNLVICVRNGGYELDLKPLEAYEVVPDESLEPDDIRVIDETGEDYIYPARYFSSPRGIQHSYPAF